MSQFTKQDIIKAGIEEGASYKKIGDVLQSQGYSRDYNPLTTVANYQQLGKNLVQNATDMARDLRTYGGMIASPLVDISRAAYEAPKGKKLNAVGKAFVKAVNDDTNRKLYTGTAAGALAGAFIPKIGPVGGAMLGSGLSTVGPKGLVDAILSSYDTSLEDIKSGKTKWQDIAQGAFRNPLYATLDTAPATGRVVSKAASNIPEVMPNALRQLVPNKQSREFNRALTQSLVGSKSRAADVYQGYLKLDNMPLADRVEMYKYITTNKGNLNKNDKALASLIRDNLRSAEKEFIDRGLLDKDLSKSNTIAQYVMQFLDDDRILHSHIEDYVRHQNHKVDRGEFMRIAGDESALRTEMLLKQDNALREKINKLAREGEELYDNNKISFFTQALSPVRDTVGNVIASDIAKTGKGYFGTRRIIGKQTPEEMGKVFDASIKHQLDQIQNIVEVEDVVSDIIKKYNLTDASNLSKDALDAAKVKGKALLSKNAFKDYVKDRFMAGKDIDISDAIRHSQTSTEGSVLIDKMYLNAINNAFKKAPSTGGRRLLNSFKKAVLANPHWIILNRIGNMTNNFMEGVTLADYRDAKNYGKLIPNQLKQQTSFNSYINAGVEGAPTSVINSFKQPFNRLLRAGERFQTGEKRLEDIGKLISEGIASSSDITANPWFKLESGLELKDRSANIIRQAKRMAERTKGKDWKQILRDAEKDNDLFSRLNTKVNKSLGDYVGRNYMLPTGYYNLLSETVPFYRFLTQTLRTTGNQLMNNPLGFASNVTIPSRLGNKLSEEIIKRYNLDKTMYKGGVPYSREATGDIRTIGFEPLPIGSVSEDIGEILKGEDLTSMLSPYLTTLPDILRFQRFGKMATTPNNPTKDTNYKPTLSDILMYGGNTLLSTIYNPYRVATTYGPEVRSLLTGKGLQSRYDTNPLLENPLTYKRTLPVELIGRWGGIQTRSNYPARRTSPNKQRQELRKIKNLERRIEQLQNK